MNHTPVNAPPQVRLAAHTGRKSGVFVLIVINSAGLSTWLVVFLLDVHSLGRGSWSRSFFQHGGGGAWQATLGDVDAVKSKRWG